MVFFSSKRANGFGFIVTGSIPACDFELLWVSSAAWSCAHAFTMPLSQVNWASLNHLGDRWWRSAEGWGRRPWGTAARLRSCCVRFISAAFAILGFKKQDLPSGWGSESKQASPDLKPEWRRERAGPELSSCIRKPDQRARGNMAAVERRSAAEAGVQVWLQRHSLDLQLAVGRAGLRTDCSPGEARAALSRWLRSRVCQPGGGRSQALSTESRHFKPNPIFFLQTQQNFPVRIQTNPTMPLLWGKETPVRVAGMPREGADGLCYHAVLMPAGDRGAQRHTQVAPRCVLAWRRPCQTNKAPVWSPVPRAACCWGRSARAALLGDGALRTLVFRASGHLTSPAQASEGISKSEWGWRRGVTGLNGGWKRGFMLKQTVAGRGRG